jgi:heme-degrading monooxygenase HmoA
MRRLGDDSTEVATISWWSSWEAIWWFAGEEFERARFYPEDDRYLLEKPSLVEHHKVVAGHTHGMVVVR